MLWSETMMVNTCRVMLAWGQFFKSESNRYESLSTKLTLTSFSQRGPPNSGGHWQMARPPRSKQGALFWQSASSHRDSVDGGTSHSWPLETERVEFLSKTEKLNSHSKGKFIPLSPVSIRTDAGITIELIQTLSSILTAMLLAVIVVYAAVITNITRRAHTPAIQKHNTEINLNTDQSAWDI